MKFHLMAGLTVAALVFGLSSPNPASAQVTSNAFVSPAQNGADGDTTFTDQNVQVGVGGAGQLDITGPSMNTLLFIGTNLTPGPGEEGGARLHVGTATGSGTVNVFANNILWVKESTPGSTAGAALQISNAPAVDSPAQSGTV